MAPAIEPTEVLPPESRGPGRPTLIEEASLIILPAIEAGNTQDTAARLAGIHPKTLSRWKAESAEFAEALSRAEAVYIAAVRVRLQGCKTKWGTDDPKAIELETRRLPEFRQHQEVTTTSLALTATVHLTADQAAQLAARHQAALEGE